jgi:hypothetical protein
MLKIHKERSLPTVELSGFEPGLLDEERAVQEQVHHFAREVMRPIGRSLDMMSAAETVAANSPFWEFHTAAAGLAQDPEALAAMPPYDAGTAWRAAADETAAALGIPITVL